MCIVCWDETEGLYILLSTNFGLINKLDDGSRDENQMDQRRFYRSRGNMSGFNLMVALRVSLRASPTSPGFILWTPWKSVRGFCILPKRRWRDISEVRRAWKSLGLTSLAPDFMAVRSRWDIKVWDESTNWLFERSHDYKYLPIFTLRMFHEFYLIVCLFLSCARRQARASRQSVCLWWIYTVQLTLWRWCLPTPSGRGTTSLWMLKKTE